MKSTLIRILAIMTLATSMSAFAATNGPKQKAEPDGSTCTSQHNTITTEKDRKTMKTPSKGQNDKDYSHSLLGIYG
jgi:Ni/Co efflux regulator RcnB